MLGTRCNCSFDKHWTSASARICFAVFPMQVRSMRATQPITRATSLIVVLDLDCVATLLASVVLDHRGDVPDAVAHCLALLVLLREVFPIIVVQDVQRDHHATIASVPIWLLGGLPAYGLGEVRGPGGGCGSAGANLA